MVSTAERLQHAVAVHAQAAAPPRHAPERELPPIAQILGGEWHHTGAGPVFVRDEWFPLSHRHGSRELASALDADAGALAHLLGAAAPAASKLAFFDIETTGLSGGAGTYMVLAGLGTYEPAAPGEGLALREGLAFRMRQYFLADLAQEPAMLAMLACDLARFDGIVTYNGRTFDLPFVEKRLTLARMTSPCGSMPHFDLLFPVRRLYRHRMPGCRLADAERKLLRIERPDDVPGWLIPSLYFEYLRAGRAAPLRGVFRHNAADVLSLVGVLAALADLLRDGAAIDPEDAVAVARFWESRGEEARAAALYEASLPWLEGGDDWGWAAWRHARLCRRAGRRGEAAALWERLWDSGVASAGVELAKHLEHHDRDLTRAREVVLQLMDGGAADAVGLRHRLTRLEAKIERARSGSRPRTAG